MKYKKLANPVRYSSNFKGGIIKINIPEKFELYVSDAGFYILSSVSSETEELVEKLNKYNQDSIMFSLLYERGGADANTYVTSDASFNSAYKNLAWLTENYDKVNGRQIDTIDLLYNDKKTFLTDKIIN